MSVTFVADVHLHNHRKFGGPFVGGLNERCRDIVAALRKATELSRGSDAFIVLGDLFDTTKPTPQMITAVMSALLDGHPNTLLLVGNHDQVSTYSGDHAMAPLGMLPNVTVVERPGKFIESSCTPLAVVPFRPGDAKSWLREDLSSMGDLKGYTVCVHLGVMDGETPHYLKEVHDAIHVDLLLELQEEFGFASVIAGNWHHHQVWDFENLKVVQTGALVPTGFDNPGLTGYGTVGELCAGKFSRQEVPGPRFVKCSDKSELSKAFESKHKVIARWTVPPSQLNSAIEEVASEFPAGRVEVIPDDAIARTNARKAAIAARSADTLEHALEAFVSSMDIPEGVSPQDVIQLARVYLGGSRG